jgi:hypothetical protein
VLTILSATVATPSHLDFDGEEGGARRWVPWIFGTKLPKRDVRSTVAIGGKPVWRLTSVGPECSPVLFREHVRIEVSYPLLALLRDLQIPECIADIGTDRLPEESGVRCS